MAKVGGVPSTQIRSPNFYPLHPAAQASSTPLIKLETYLPDYMFILHVLLDLFVEFSFAYDDKQVYQLYFINIHL